MARRSVRRWFFLGVASAAAVACGLDLVGGTSTSGPEQVLDGAARPSPTARPDAPVGALDAGVSTDAEADADAASCVPDGSFCDPCDPDLVLCVRFDGGAVDESMYRRPIEIDGSATFLNDNGLGVVSLDGSAVFTVPGTGPHLQTYDALSYEVLARVREYPAAEAGARFGLVDRNGSGSIFLYGADGGTGSMGPHLRCFNHDIPQAPPVGAYVHFACVMAGGNSPTVGVFLDGKRVALLDAATGPDPVISQLPEEPFRLFGNAITNPELEGPDHFLGEVATIRIYTRRLTSAEISDAAARD